MMCSRADRFELIAEGSARFGATYMVTFVTHVLADARTSGARGRSEEARIEGLGWTGRPVMQEAPVHQEISFRK
jgi:hypothetical protein